MSSILKTCRVCKKDKPLSEFYKRKDSPDGHRNDCKACKNAKQKEWDARNQEKLREHKRQYYRDNYMGTEEQRRKQKRWNKEYYRRNRQDMLERARKYRNSKNGRETRRQYRQRRYVKERHRKRMRRFMQTERWKEYKREWRRNNRDRVRDYCRRRRSATRASEGEMTLSQWRKLVELAGDSCLCCGDGEDLTVDHIIPVSRGGDGYVANIQPLCMTCNSSKNDRAIDYRPKEIREWAHQQTALTKQP